MFFKEILQMNFWIFGDGVSGSAGFPQQKVVLILDQRCHTAVLRYRYM